MIKHLFAVGSFVCVDVDVVAGRQLVAGLTQRTSTFIKYILLPVTIEFDFTHFGPFPKSIISINLEIHAFP